MTDESLLTQEADAVEIEAVETPVDGEDTVAAVEETPEQKKERETSKERREREKASKERIKSELAQAKADLDAANKKLQDADKLKSATAKPKQSDFAEYDDFQAANTAWMVGQHMSNRESAEATEAAKSARERAEAIEARELAEIDKGWASQFEEAKGRYADFEKVVQNPTVPINDTVAFLIKTSAQGADVAYHLGMNPDLAAELSGMHPLVAAREIGKLETKLSAPKARTETNAPAPITPVGGATTTGRDPSKMTVAEFSAWRQAGGKI